MASPESINKHYVDPMLANPSGHALLADVLIAYFQSQACRAWDIATGRETPEQFWQIGNRKGLSASSFPTRRLFDHAALKGKHGKGKPDKDSLALFGGVGERKGVPPEKMEVSDEDPDADWKHPIRNVDKSQSLLRSLVRALSHCVNEFCILNAMVFQSGSSHDDRHETWRSGI